MWAGVLRGSLEASFPSFKNGKMSRSLVAAYQLLEAGVVPAKTTVHLQVSCIAPRNVRQPPAHPFTRLRGSWHLVCCRSDRTVDRCMLERRVAGSACALCVESRAFKGRHRAPLHCVRARSAASWRAEAALTKSEKTTHSPSLRQMAYVSPLDDRRPASTAPLPSAPRHQ
jgi:hypothetical protein